MLAPEPAVFMDGGGLRALANYRQFLVCKYIPTEKPGKYDKIPIDPLTGRAIDAHLSSAWVDWSQALAAAHGFGPDYGVAFVLSDFDPFFFIDIDDCLGTDGNWTRNALDILRWFEKCAVEISSSESGLHVIGTATGYPAHGCKNKELGADLYTSKRFIALTGKGLLGDAGHDHSANLTWFVRRWFPKSVPLVPGGVPTSGPDHRWCGPADDEELLHRMLNSRGSAAAAFGGGASIADLWEANADVLAKAYPDTSGSRNAYNASSADAALAAHLAFWTGADVERMERLMRRSALAREKWDSHRTYLTELTLTNAANRQRAKGEFLNDPSALKPEQLAPMQAQDSLAGISFLGTAETALLFGDFTYVMAQNGVLLPSGRLAKHEQFDALFGGPTFALDGSNTKFTKSAWDAMLKNPTFTPRRVDDVIYDPTRPFNTLIKDDDGESMVNVYRDVRGKMADGDPSPFLQHLDRLIPDARDRDILLHFMAATVQQPHKRVRWALVLHGAEGNGKTLLVECLRYAVGHKASHSPRSTEMTGKFNGWMQGKLLITVDDVAVGRDRSSIETLKPMITDDWIAVEPKNFEQVMRKIYANFIFTTNLEDSVAIHANDRRFCIIRTAQQTAQDIELSGMNSEYFRWIFDWLENRDGYAIVAKYIRTYGMRDDLNPFVGANRAPKTRSVDSFITASMSSNAAQVREWVEAGVFGFCGGFIDSHHIGVMSGNKITTRGLAAVAKELGYVPHPAFPDGRPPNPFMPDCDYKPKIYVVSGSEAASMLDGRRVMQFWLQCNKVFG